MPASPVLASENFITHQTPTDLPRLRFHRIRPKTAPSTITESQRILLTQDHASDPQHQSTNPRKSATIYTSQPQPPVKKETIAENVSSKTSPRVSSPFHFSDYTGETSVTSTNLRFTTSKILIPEANPASLHNKGKSRPASFLGRRPKTSNALPGASCHRISGDSLRLSSHRDESNERKKIDAEEQWDLRQDQKRQSLSHPHPDPPQDEKDHRTSCTSRSLKRRSAILSFLQKLSPSTPSKKTQINRSQSQARLPSDQTLNSESIGIPVPAREEVPCQQIPTSKSAIGSLPPLTAENLALLSQVEQYPPLAPPDPELNSQARDHQVEAKRLRRQSVGTQVTLASSSTFPLASPPSPFTTHSPKSMKRDLSSNARPITPLIEDERAGLVSPSESTHSGKGRGIKSPRPKTRRGLNQ